MITGRRRGYVPQPLTSGCRVPMLGAPGRPALEDERPTMRLHREASPDKHTEIHRIVASETIVACHLTVTATHGGPYLDLEPTGKTVVVHEMMFNEVRDGRLALTWAMESGVGFYEQIPGRPKPEGLDNLG